MFAGQTSPSLACVCCLTVANVCNYLCVVKIEVIQGTILQEIIKGGGPLANDTCEITEKRGSGQGKDCHIEVNARTTLSDTWL